MTDIEIAKTIKLRKIADVANDLNIHDIDMYGNYKAKINPIDKQGQGKLILVTAINPTPLGEGKTTVSISLADALNKLGYKAISDLREPSLGPVFGLKGGATGGGYAQIVPMEDINLHFTGDLHAITAANNLLSSVIYNHIYFGNELGFEEVLFKRCMDLNDRSLRDITFEVKDQTYKDSFDITAASEIMAIVCLSKDIEDLRTRLGKIIVGKSKNGFIEAKKLGVVGSLVALLKDALKPNLVQTLEGNPALVHTGPFANISIGCSSVISTNTALNLADYVVTEAGFGADLGAEKFFDIKCRGNFKPALVVIVATLKSLKYHGNCPIEECLKENIEYLKQGLNNLYVHVENMKKVYHIDVVVAINKYHTDTDAELEFLYNTLKEKGIAVSITDGYKKGSVGSVDLAKQVVELAKDTTIQYAYNMEDDIKTKIQKVATKIYRASGVEYSEEALQKIAELEQLNLHLPVCIAKTQYSLSDDAHNLMCENDYVIHVKDIEIKAGAGYIVVLTGKILTMPGLPKEPNALGIDVQNNEIIGII